MTSRLSRLESRVAKLEAAIGLSAIPNTPVGPVESSVLLKRVASVFDVTPTAILSRRRPALVVSARHALWHILVTDHGWKACAIVRHYRVDDSTVSHALRSASHRMKAEPWFSKRVRLAR